MTHDEFDALPDVSLGFGIREEVRDGRIVRCPVMGDAKVMGMPPADQPMAVIDSQGRKWRIGLVDGVLSKRRSLS